MSAFYKTNHPDVMAAVTTMQAENKALHAAGAAFGEAFGGKPFYLRDHNVHFGGLVFTPRKDRMFWTVPGKHDEQAPRAKPRPGATAPQREEHNTLRAKWLAEWTKLRVSADAMYEAIGTDWGSLLFSGIGYAERNGWLYVTTKASLNDRMTEILGSEYRAAFYGAP